MRKTRSVLKKKQRKLKKKTRGGRLFTCYDTDTRMKIRSWTPCSFSKNLTSKNPNSEHHKQKFAEESNSTKNSRPKNFINRVGQKTLRYASTFGKQMLEKWDNLFVSPQMQKDAEEFLHFVVFTPCCDNFKLNIINRYFKEPKEPKDLVKQKYNLSILKFIVNEGILKAYKKNEKEHDTTSNNKQEELEKILFNLENEVIDFEVEIEELNDYTALVNKLKRSLCNEINCDTFHENLTTPPKSFHTKYGKLGTLMYHKYLKHILLHNKLSNILKNKKIQDFLEGKILSNTVFPSTEHDKETSEEIDHDKETSEEIDDNFIDEFHKDLDFHNSSAFDFDTTDEQELVKKYREKIHQNPIYRKYVKEVLSSNKHSTSSKDRHTINENRIIHLILEE